jgi:WD40 repeat protein
LKFLILKSFLATYIIAGSKEGVIAVLNLKQSLTVRLIHDHKGAPITSIDTALDQNEEITYWLAASRDRRVSVWQGKKNEEKHNLIDWLTFSAPALDHENDNKKLNKQKKPDSWLIYPPSLAKFSTKTDPDTIVYVGYGVEKNMLFYCLKNKKVMRTLSINEWPECMTLTPKCHLIAMGTKTRLLQLKDYNEGSYQDYAQHSDTVSAVCFSNDGKRLFSASFSEIFIWNVTV